MANDSYPTDESIMNCFNEWFDPCPLNDNPEFNGLDLEWEDKTFVNPPYSKPLPWVEKAINEANKGKRIVMLLKADTSTRAYAKLHNQGSLFFWVSRRLKYGTGKPAPFPSMLVILKTKKSDDKDGR